MLYTSYILYVSGVNILGVSGCHALETTKYILYAYRPYKDSSSTEREDSLYSDVASDQQAAEDSSASNTDSNESGFGFVFEFLLHVLEFIIQALL